MLCFGKKTDYALIALGHLAGLGKGVASAREIASQYQLPEALLMKLMKLLQQHGVLESKRGSKGGYCIATDLARLTLFELVAVLECNGHKPDRDCGCMESVDPLSEFTHRHRPDAIAPVRALHEKLQRFLKDVKVADLILPGRRIDVPLSSVGKLKSRSTPPANLPAAEFVQLV